MRFLETVRLAGPSFSNFKILLDVNNRRSLLVQGGLEIPIRLTIEMDAGEKNIQALKKYEDLVSEYYKTPVNGKFKHATASVLETLKSDDSDIEESGQEEDDQEYSSGVYNPRS